MVAVNVAVVAPAATKTDAGTLTAAALELCSVTVKPPAGAAAATVIVPVLGVPPTTDVGSTVTDFTTVAIMCRVAV